MFAFDRRISLEDQQGGRCPAYLLEIIAGHSFVLCSPASVKKLKSLDLEAEWEEFCETLASAIRVMDIRTHCFLSEPEAAQVLVGSTHKALRAVALLWEKETEEHLAEVPDALSSQAFAAECRRRTSLL
ncbi:MAG: hypothetical protein VKN33_02410 [Candidatus Sericytochromatia bacterium]|nr:hypothetical protein [Candidatus Sericytochromatia bacterium]